jgi:hypothetical protein
VSRPACRWLQVARFLVARARATRGRGAGVPRSHDHLASFERVGHAPLLAFKVDKTAGNG